MQNINYYTKVAQVASHMSVHQNTREGNESKERDITPKPLSNQ